MKLEGHNSRKQITREYSFNAGSLKVGVKVDDLDQDKSLAIKNEFDFRTECFFTVLGM